jgi:hypothetical protein
VCQVQSLGHFLQLLSAGGEETAEQPAVAEFLGTEGNEEIETY